MGSKVIDIEILKIKDEYKRQKVIELASLKNEYIAINDDIVKKALEFENKGIKAYDSLHLACAEISNVDVFLTTDDKLMKSVRKLSSNIRVLNPVQWFVEVIQFEDGN
ncbi:PIN domain-containing protein [Herbivorax sp. ANBcel31]|uniref:PIN domain-containing protein n=1 Tax=Herbivorax sp. ANBcel31 TaxID=3069754 RepID=UPI0027B2CC55|nr:PIN domain-containing protein [Herbivorax sp. ANBcel31]MDQ2085742.1 PIN domain-containing protein [Herbivorax sp. ANBcel31]